MMWPQRSGRCKKQLVGWRVVRPQNAHFLTYWAHFLTIALLQPAKISFV